MNLPKDLNLYMTSRCNFKCSHCSRRQNKPTAKDVTLDLVKRIFDIYPISSVCIAGFGEPLLNPNTMDIIKWLNERNIRPGLITNGSLIKDYLEQLADVELVYLSVSLNEPTSDLHEKTSGTKTFNRIVNNFLKLKDMVRSYYPMGISKVCSKGNLESVPNFIRFGSYLGANFVHLVNFLPYNEEAIKHIITINDRKDLEFLDRCRNIPEAIRVKHWPIPIGGECPHTCNSPWKSIGINGDGYISGCRRVFGPSKRFGRFDDYNIWGGSSGIYNLREAINVVEEIPSDPMFNELVFACIHCFGNYKPKKEKR